MSRTLLACLLATVAGFAPDALRAQEPVLDAKSAAHTLTEYRTDLTMVHDKLLDLADSIPAEKYAWRPAPEVRSVSEVLMHIAGEWYYVCPISVGEKPAANFNPPRPAMQKLEQTTAKADVLEQLNRSWAYCTAAFSAADPTRLMGKYEPAKMSLARAALRVTGDQHEHLGQLVTYARSVGVKPSWSK